MKILMKTILLLLVILLGTGCIKNPYQTQKLKKTYTSDKDVLMFILDGSGSMGSFDNSGKIKMLAAKKMLKDISNQIDNTKTNVGLIGFSNGCRSTKLLIEPSNNDLKHVVDVSNNINASGKTPLAQSIKTAGLVLKDIKKKVNIIIISDGEETCGGNPIYEAKRLKATYGIDAKIYVVGYSVDNRTKYQLENLAKAGNGQYYAAKDANALNTIITNITDELKIKSDNWKGDTYKFKINFNSSSSKLKKKYNKQIEKLAKYLINTNYSAEIQGHTDSIGNAKINQKLSEKRAKAVANRLIKFGVPKNHVYAVGFGELAPIASNKTKQGRYENRRVEAHIIKDGKMDISYINKANSKNKINVRNATTSSFIGYYKVLDTKRTYKNYHIWMELYANNSGLFGEFLNGKLITKPNEETFAWKYSKNKMKFLLDFTDNNKRPGSAEFNGKVKGNTNNFKLLGHWASGSSGTIKMIRITKDELDCMKKSGIYKNKVCSK